MEGACNLSIQLAVKSSNQIASVLNQPAINSRPHYAKTEGWLLLSSLKPTSPIKILRFITLSKTLRGAISDVLSVLMFISKHTQYTRVNAIGVGTIQILNIQ